MEEKETQRNSVLSKDRGLQDQMDGAAFDLSKYRELADGNKEVLQNLLMNAIRSIEEYKVQFAAAAEKEDLQSLSDLIHKNTTNLHYLQAARIDRQIREFRCLLRDPAVQKNKSKEKAEIVLQEFEEITEGIKTELENIS